MDHTFFAVEEELVSKKGSLIEIFHDPEIMRTKISFCTSRSLLSNDLRDRLLDSFAAQQKYSNFQI